MISIVGIGNAASAIASLFKGIKNYDTYVLNSNVEKNTKSDFKIAHLTNPEDGESEIPDLSGFFKDVRDRVQIFVMGSSMSSNYTLGILEQLKDKQIDLFYIKPDVELLTGVPKTLEKITFGVLQEYARSGMFRNITLISNLNLEKILGDIPIKNYYNMLNEAVFSAIHYLNYFEFTEPEIGQISQPSEINRIRSIALLDVKNLEEKWLFDLDTPRELCYYICINEEKLMTEGGLHRKLVDMLKDKPTNAFRKLSYAIYETDRDDFGFCVAHTNVIQEEKTLDNLGQE
jgi:hypothetical protein